MRLVQANLAGSAGMVSVEDAAVCEMAHRAIADGASGASFIEMGGKDPMIVCADADLDRAANAAATMGLLNSGQICLSVERIYVEDEVHDKFVEKLVSAVGQLRQRGVTSAGEADVGSMTFPPQIETVERHVAIETESELCRGRTVVDLWGRTGEPPNAHVAVGIDSAAFLTLLEERIAALG